MKEKLMMVALIFSLTVNAAAFITTGYFWGRNYTSREAVKDAGPPPFGTEISLDQGQRDRMRELRKSFMNETAPVRDDLMIKRVELARLLSSEGPDRASLEQKLGEINDLQLRMQIGVIDQLFREKAFLSPEQQARYVDFISHRLCQDFLPGRKGHRGHRGRGMGPQDGRGGMGEGRRMQDHLTGDQ
jgi:Spy/CpxP family protein refolding chaperone